MQKKALLLRGKRIPEIIQSAFLENFAVFLWKSNGKNKNEECSFQILNKPNITRTFVRLILYDEEEEQQIADTYNLQKQEGSFGLCLPKEIAEML